MKSGGLLNVQPTSLPIASSFMTQLRDLSLIRNECETSLRGTLLTRKTKFGDNPFEFLISDLSLSELDCPVGNTLINTSESIRVLFQEM